MLKTKLVEPLVLGNPGLQGLYTVDMDACDKEIVFVLLQKQPDRADQTTGYWSGSLNKADCAYDTTHYKGLTVVWAVLWLQPYLEGSLLTVWTDLDAIKWILDLTYFTGRLVRWQLSLSEI